MLKDEKLSFIYNTGNNIARFLSISPENKIRHINIDDKYVSKGDIREDILNLISISSGNSVNIRSFSEDSVKGNAFIYGKTACDIDEIMDIISKNCKDGKYSIINETIDVNDGGVSGVIMGNMIEFSPNDTPRCVEKAGVCRLPLNLGIDILNKVYGFFPEHTFGHNYRIEFSIHPHREGVRNSHTIIWEYEEIKDIKFDVKVEYPNNFSKFIGDKTFGLLVADFFNFRVPYTGVLCRNVAPFSFGKPTGLNEKWIRTAPAVKESGKFFTGDTWQDPFELMAKEEAKGDSSLKNISSILYQNAVSSVYSGGAIVTADELLIEGVSGKGDNFMLGENADELSCDVRKTVELELKRFMELNSVLGDVSCEWVYDGTYVWIVQLNQLRHASSKNVLVEGNPEKYISFDVSIGLEALRKLALEIQGKNIGIKLIGNVGVTSHFGDVLRQHDIPSYIENVPA